MRTCCKCILLAMVLLTGAGLKAQIIIDMSTGVDNVTGLPMQVGKMDDTWTVAPYNPTYQSYYPYQPVYCGNGLRDGLGTAFPVGAGPKPHAMWVAPYINAQGYHLYHVSGANMYKMSFNLWSCPIQGATMHFNLFGADNTAFDMFVNGTYHNVYQNPFNPGVFTNNVSIPIPFEINQGLNEITFLVGDGEAYPGLEIDGYLEIETCAGVDYRLKNQDGVEKNEFCMNESVFISGNGTFPNNAQINLLTTSGGFTSTVQSASVAGLQNGFDVTSVFAASLQNPNLGTYRLELVVGSCQFYISNDFKFVCCEDVTPFNLFNNGYTLTGSSPVKGNHTWDIYNFPAGNGGAYTPVTTINTQSFSWDQTASCSYVTLTVENACGVVCTGQSVCNIACEVEPCILSAPQNVRQVIVPPDNLITWDPVAGADHYLVEVIQNDPLCCWDGGGPRPISETTHYTSATNSYNLNEPPPAIFPGSFNPPRPCYSVKVYAVCADGSRSEASASICMQH